VPEELRQNYVPHGFKGGQNNIKALFVVGEPRKYSLTYDLVNTAMQHLEQNGWMVELRDLYDLNFDPVLHPAEFYYVKDGLGQAPAYLAQEQALVRQADVVVFAYPNLHDGPISIVKGYIEKVFAAGFAYKDGPNGPAGLLAGKHLYTIMNCGYLGGGQGYVGDGCGQNDQLWDQYMKAFKVFDDDTAQFWGMNNAGRFVNDRRPQNFASGYQEQLTSLRAILK
ncbi:flavodoxin family protein, partial [Lactobacillus sp. XV13L]|nr:flavodoxin family protein [Lactobacillus sp. XV13L]